MDWAIYQRGTLSSDPCDDSDRASVNPGCGDDAARSQRAAMSDTLREGQHLGRFLLERKLGAGTFGAVWQARDTTLGEVIAVKVLHPWLADEKTALERLKREVVLARRITHQNVCRLFDLHEVDGQLCVTMELIAGESAVERLMRAPVPFGHANVIFRQLISGMAAAHDCGVIHRDIKPSNVLLRSPEPAAAASADGDPPQPVLLDFGIARSGSMQQLTRPGTLVGTLRFMAPELWNGAEAGPLSDQYAMGMVGFALYSRRLPYPAMNTPREQLDAIKQNPRGLQDVVPAFPTAIAAVIERAIRIEPAQRFPDAHAFLNAFNAAVATVTDDLDLTTDPRGRRARGSNVDVIFGGGEAAVGASDEQSALQMAASGDVIPISVVNIDGPTVSTTVSKSKAPERRLVVAAGVLALVAAGLGVVLVLRPAPPVAAPPAPSPQTPTPSLATIDKVAAAADVAPGIAPGVAADAGDDAPTKAGPDFDARLAAARARMTALGLRPGDVPAVDGHLSRAAALQRKNLSPSAALTAAGRELDAVVVNEAFVRRKIDRFNSALALASRAIPDVHSALRPTGQKIASQTSARDFVGANKTLNEGFASLEKLERGEQRNKKP